MKDSVFTDLSKDWQPVHFAPILQIFKHLCSCNLNLTCRRDLAFLLPFFPSLFLSIQNLQASIDKAVGYLERRLPSLVNPYAVAITSYAMANENKLNREIFFKFSSPGAVTQQSKI